MFNPAKEKEPTFVASDGRIHYIEDAYEKYPYHNGTKVDTNASRLWDANADQVVYSDEAQRWFKLHPDHNPLNAGQWAVPVHTYGHEWEPLYPALPIDQTVPIPTPIPTPVHQGDPGSAPAKDYDHSRDPYNGPSIKDLLSNKYFLIAIGAVAFMFTE